MDLNQSVTAVQTDKGNTKKKMAYLPTHPHNGRVGRPTNNFLIVALASDTGPVANFADCPRMFI